MYTRVCMDPLQVLDTSYTLGTMSYEYLDHYWGGSYNGTRFGSTRHEGVGIPSGNPTTPYTRVLVVYTGAYGFR